MDNFGYVFNSIFEQLFSTFDKNVLLQCQYYTGYLPLLYKVHFRRLNFLIDLSLNSLSLASVLFEWFGHMELDTLLRTYNIKKFN